MTNEIQKLEALKQELEQEYYNTVHAYGLRSIPKEVSARLNYCMNHAAAIGEKITKQTGVKPKVDRSSNVKNAISFIRIAKEGKI